MAQFPNLANITSQSSMRVLQLIDNLHAGGAERMAVQIANALHKRLGYSALCCTREEGLLREQLKSEIDYLHAHRKGILGIIGIYRIYLFIKRNKITHLHAHSTSIQVAFLLTLIFPKLKLIWHDHFGNADFIKSRPTKKIKLISHKIDFIISVNEHLQNWAMQNKLCDHVEYLSNFATLVKSNAKNAIGVGKPDMRVVCVANLRPQKGQLLLIEVWREINLLYPEWSLLLVGKKFSDRYESLILQKIKEYNLESVIHVLGSRSDISNILDQSTIGVLSSYSEGLPVALLEYGLAGLPVIVTNVGACKEVVQNKGKVIPVNDVETFKVEMLELIKNQSKREDLGKRFQEHVHAHYSEDGYMERIIRIYNKCND